MPSTSSGVEGIRFCHFEDVDVVRHHLVQRIVRAYDTYGPRSSSSRSRSRPACQTRRRPTLQQPVAPIAKPQ